MNNSDKISSKPVTPVVLEIHALFPEVGAEVCDKPVRVLGFKHNSTNLMSVLVPPVDDNFVFPADVLRDIVVFHRFGQPGQGLYLSGPTGCGKSASVRQYCARTGIGLTFAVASRTSEVQDFIGGMGIFDGDTVFKKGPLLQAMQHGMWFLLDEIDLLDPGIATAINLILDGSGYLIVAARAKVTQLSE